MNKSKPFSSGLWLALIPALLFWGCKHWEYNVVKNGIPFEKISQSEKGTNIGYMTEDSEIQGVPCEKGWVHFRKDWQLLSCQLSREHFYRGTLLPAHTWLHFPYHAGGTGYVCSFPHDYEVQGYPCGGSGGYKGTHTAFYDSGRLRSFFPPGDVTVDGVPCDATPLVYVGLYENGRIKSCRLAGDYQGAGKTYRKGQTIAFDESGNPR